LLYIRKGPPKVIVAQKTAEIKRRDTWKNLPDDAPTDKDGAAKYTETLRSMFDEFSKPDIRETVIQEQHALCCYCMRRICNSGSDMRIEHWYPLNLNKTSAIEYSNFLGACTGIYSQDRSERQCCDNSKSGETIMLDPQNQSMMNQIKYKSDGEIYFEESPAWTDEQVDRFTTDINDTLQLNGDTNEKVTSENSNNQKNNGCNELKSQREAVLRACREELSRMQRRKRPSALSVKEVQELVNKIEAKEEYPEYAGVMLFFYNRWIKNHQT